MGSFEDQLWSELARAHGDELSRARREPARHGRTRPVALTAGAFGVVGAVTVVSLALTATTGTPAYAVTEHTDGTVAITIHDLIGVDGANAELAKLGVPVRAVTIDSSCHGTYHPDPNLPPVHGTVLVRSTGQDEITVRPANIPAGDTLLLAAKQVGSRVAMSIALVRDPAPSCLGVIRHLIGPGGASTGPSR